MGGFTQRYKSIFKVVLTTLEITTGILLETFGILIEFTVISEKSEHLPYLRDAITSQVVRGFV